MNIFEKGWDWLTKPVDPNDQWLRALPVVGTPLAALNRGLGAKNTSNTANNNVGGAGKSTVATNPEMRIGAGAMAGLGLGPIGSKVNIPQLQADAARYNAPASGGSALEQQDAGVNLESMMREIQDRLASSRAVAPTVALNTRPIDTAKDASLKELTNALNTIIGGIEVARNSTKGAYGQAKEGTQGAYDHIVDNSRKEGKKAATESGDYTQKALSDAAAIAMAGTNKDLTDSEALQKQASANLGGNAAALKAIQGNVDPANTAATVRDNIAQNFQDTANNAAKQTSRDINSASRYADTIASDGASAIANLEAELANRNNMFDRDISDARSTNANNVANIQSTYADKLMQAQLAQQQEQSALDRTAWQTNTNNDAAALQGMIDLLQKDVTGRNDLQLAQFENQAKQENNATRSQDKQLEILLRGLTTNTDRNSMSSDQLLEMLKQLQG